MPTQREIDAVRRKIAGLKPEQLDALFYEFWWLTMLYGELTQEEYDAGILAWREGRDPFDAAMQALADWPASAKVQHD